MRIENNDVMVIATMTPDEADLLATLLNAALQERLQPLNPDDQELWEHIADGFYYAGVQAHAIHAKNLGG